MGKASSAEFSTIRAGVAGELPYVALLGQCNGHARFEFSWTL